jgi:hypothetical protein
MDEVKRKKHASGCRMPLSKPQRNECSLHFVLEGIYIYIIYVCVFVFMCVIFLLWISKIYYSNILPVSV